MTGLYPCAEMKLGEGRSVWGVAGGARGSLKLTPDSGTAMRTDMGLVMAAAGGRTVLLAAGADGGLELAGTGDAMVMRSTSDPVRTARGNLDGAEATVSRLRAGVEERWHGLRIGQSSLVPLVELGLRHDAGDAETGYGADVGAGIEWRHDPLGLVADIRARGLLAHEAGGFAEHGVAGTLTLDPRPDSDRGLWLTLGHTVGAQASGGAQTLLGRATMDGLAEEAASGGQRFEATVGYGFALGGNGFTGTPELGVAFGEHEREYRAGWTLGLARQGRTSFELKLDARRSVRLDGDGEPDHALGLRLSAEWQARGGQRSRR